MSIVLSLTVLDFHSWLTRAQIILFIFFVLVSTYTVKWPITSCCSGNLYERHIVEVPFEMGRRLRVQQLQASHKVLGSRWRNRIFPPAGSTIVGLAAGIIPVLKVKI